MNLLESMCESWDNYLISKYDLYNNKNERLGYILNFMKLDDIDIRIVESFKVQIIIFFSHLLTINQNALFKFINNDKYSLAFC